MKRKRALFELVSGGGAAINASLASSDVNFDESMAFSDVDIAIQILRRDFRQIVALKPTAAQQLQGQYDAKLEPIAPLPVVLVNEVRERVKLPVESDLALFTAHGKYKLCKAPIGPNDYAVIATGDLLDYAARRSAQAASGKGPPFVVTGNELTAASSSSSNYSSSSTSSTTNAKNIGKPPSSSPPLQRAAFDLLSHVYYRCSDSSLSQSALSSLYQEWVHAGRPHAPKPGEISAAVKEEAAATDDGSPSAGAASLQQSNSSSYSSSPPSFSSQRELADITRVLLQLGALTRRTDASARSRSSNGGSGGGAEDEGLYGSLRSLVSAGSTIPPPPPRQSSNDGTSVPITSSSTASRPPLSSSSSSAAGPSVANDGRECYWLGVPEAGRLWQYLIAGRAELLAKLRQRRYNEMLRADAEKLKLTKSPLDPKLILREMIGSGLLSVVRSPSGEFVKVAS